jgi:inhibitor of cysteine peptidase
MKHDDLMHKLENLETPEIELHGHKQALKMFLLNSGRFNQRPIMHWAKVFAPIAAAVLLIAMVGLFVVNAPESGAPFDLANLGGNQINRFSSYDEFEEFVTENTQNKAYYRAPGLFFLDITGGVIWKASAESNALFAPGADDSSTDYSATNIQVAGVDEADIVKTDGEYIYLVSGNRTIIVKAYPPEQAQIVSEIELQGTISGIFISGDRLVVFGQETSYPLYYDVRMVTEERLYMPYEAPKTFVKVYDVSDTFIENPSLTRDVAADGQYVSSRMIGDYVYVVINEPIYEEGDEPTLPRLYSGDEEKEIPATDIYYSSNVSDYYYMYTTIMAINTQDDDQNPTYATMLLGASSNLYVSTDNIYLTVPVWRGDVGDSEGTTIHRIHIDDGAMNYTASGEVPGMVLDQFSMDEYDGYFRVATTTWDETSRNNVYILNMSLNITGLLTELAPGETIYSARFMGERCYLVTFKQIDPLFVIDLEDPYAPEVLGYLKVTGYSDYLHPYDENHIIGIGKETTDAGEFAWFQGVKISLFDVTDVSHPIEISKVEIGDRGSDSPVLWDHKAFLFDRERNLLVMPILEAKVDQSKYTEEELAWAYGEPVYQGAYVFNVSLDGGIQLRDTITHIDGSSDIGWDYYYYYPFSVERSLYIGNVLYTISQAKIKMNNLETLDDINEVELPYSIWTPYDYLPGDEEPREEPSWDAEPGPVELPDK